MIKCSKEEVELNGDELTLRAEASIIICPLKAALIENGDSEKTAKAKIEQLVEVGMMSEEERSKKTKEARRQIVENLILGGLFK